MEGAILPALLNVGAIGGITVWLLTRMDRKLDRMERALNRLCRTQLIEILSRPTTSETVREQATAVLKEIDNGSS